MSPGNEFCVLAPRGALHRTYTRSVRLEVFRVPTNVMPLPELRLYKERLAREMDRQDRHGLGSSPGPGPANQNAGESAPSLVDVLPSRAQR